MRIPLEKIRPIVEELTMLDECIIVEDPELTGDDTWDEDTGTYEPPVDDESTVYEGICSVYKRGGETIVTAGGEELVENSYWIAIPADEEVTILPEQKVTITAVGPLGDPELVGKEFIVRFQEYSTLTSSRRIAADLQLAKP